MSSIPKIPQILIIVGPTASGKSDLAVRLAKRLNGEIISADSRQVYKGLDIGSGKITKREMRGVPHYLLDVANPTRTFTVAQYQKLGRAAIKKIITEGKLPIICGGAGLYIDALITNAIFPNVKPNLKLRRTLERESAETLFKKLRELDPRRATTIDRYNKRRLIRAIEIVMTTGNAVSPQAQHSDILQNVGMFPVKVVKVGIQLSPEELKKRIHERLGRRLKQGMVREVKELHKNGASWKRLDALGLEYRFVSRYLRKIGNPSTITQGRKALRLAKEEMMEYIEKESWHYAKRQMTWWRRDKEIIWCASTRAAEQTARKILSAR